MAKEDGKAYKAAHAIDVDALELTVVRRQIVASARAAGLEPKPCYYETGLRWFFYGPSGLVSPDPGLSDQEAVAWLQQEP
jgi:hypothetical protein